MSNSASIAAAKRRRGVSQNPPVSNNSASKNINRVNSEPTLEVTEKNRQKISPIQILGMHENRLEFLEKNHNTMAMALNRYPNPNEEKIVTLKDLEEFRQAFQKLSSGDNKIAIDSGNEINLEKIKKEVTDEFSKTQMVNLVTKTDVDNIISLFKKELLNENIKNLENKINELKVTKEKNETIAISQSDIDNIEKTLTKKLEETMSKSSVTNKNLEDLKAELIKKFEVISMSKDYISRKEHIEMKNILTTKINEVKTKSEVVSKKDYDAMKTKMDTLENKVKSLEELVLKK